MTSSPAAAKRARIVIPEFMGEASVAALASVFDVLYQPELVDRQRELLANIATADAVIVRNRTQVDSTFIAAAPRLRVVGRLGVGLDNIDLDACSAHGIEVIPATGANALAVAEYVIGAAMLLLRGSLMSTDAVAAGKWPRGELSGGREIHGTTLGIIGFGVIGRLTGKLGRAVGMRAVGYDAQLPPATPAWAEDRTAPKTLPEVIAEADVLTLHVPLTAATRNLIDAGRIHSMKGGAILINAARGGVVDEAAVAAALRSGRLGGAALDVFDHEPLAAGSPLAGCPRLILTPHVAGITREANGRVSTLIADRVRAALLAHD